MYPSTPTLSVELFQFKTAPVIDILPTVSHCGVVGADVSPPHHPLHPPEILAEHAREVFPQLLPRHTHVHGPFPIIPLTVPLLQRFVVGTETNIPPSASPHAPCIG